MSSASESTKPTEVFACYAHEDRHLWAALARRLSDLQRQGLITSWSDRDISPGTDWAREIDAHLSTASLILLLISSYFVDSDYCYSVEMKRALEKHDSGEARVIPIILRPTDWEGAPFGRLQCFPPNAKPVTTWRNRETAFTDIAKNIEKVIKELKTTTYEAHQDVERNFFISYNGADRNWAEWISWQLEEAGYSTIVQAWDFRTGSNFLLDMDKARDSAKQTIAVLSPNYLNTIYDRPEWASAFLQDPSGIEGTLLPIRVRKCTPRGILASIVYIDLVGLDEENARRRLLEGISFSHRRSTTPPAFPGRVRHSFPKEPYFPDALASVTPRLPETFPAIWNIPYLHNPLFTGREEILQHLHDTLNSGKTALITQAIIGLGGIGKTQTVIEYAYQYRGDYQAILWAKADTREGLTSDFIAIADLLNLPHKSEQDQNLVINAVKQWLSEHTSWLLILDNVEDMELIKDFIPAESKGHILLTSRNHSLDSISPVIQIEQMDMEEGILLLLRRARILAPEAQLEQATSEERSQAETIVVMLGGLPLAIDQAGAYIEETNCTLAAYLHIYQMRQRELMEQRGYSETSYLGKIATTWSLCFQVVAQTNFAALDLLCLCAFLRPDAIPEEIVDRSAGLDPHLESVAADPFALNAALNELRRFSLIHRDLEAKTLSIHPLVQDLLQDNMDEETRRQWAECAVQAVCRTFPSVEFASWQRCQLFLPHALACTTLIEQWQMPFAEATSLLNRVGYYLCVRARYQEAEPLFKKALAIDERAPESRPSSVASDLHRLAEVYRAQGKYTEAEDLYQRALNLYEQVQGVESADVAELLSNLADLYNDQGKYTQAMPLYERALALWEQSLGQEHPNSIQALNSLAEVYKVQGKYEQVEILLKKAISLGERALGAEHPTVAISLHNLAALYAQQGKYEQAEPLSQRALQIREQVLGPEHPDIATSLNNLAMLYAERGKYEQAEPLSQRALQIREQVLGPEHPDIATSLNNLAMLYAERGKYEQAEPLYQRALQIREQVLGPKHPDMATSLNNLAMLYVERGKYEQAEPLYLWALQIREQVLGPEHPNMAASVSNLASLYDRQGKYEQAEPLYLRALQIREQAFGSDHLAVATSLHVLANLYSHMAKYSEAEPLYLRARYLYEKILGPNHPNVVRALRDYAILLRVMAREEEARQIDMQEKYLRSR